MEPRLIVFKEWRDTRTFSNLKSTHLVRKEWKNYSTLQSNIQILLRINLWCNSPWSNNQIVIPRTKCVIPSWAWAKFVTPRTFHAFFFIHGDNKVPFQTVLEIYICVFIFDRSCVLLKTKY
jgi:hypothetical protein